MDLTIPHDFEPRSYQVAAFNALSDGFRRSVCVWHRRSGKDKTFLNIMIKEMLKRVGNYYYYFPTGKQGRKIIWDGKDKAGLPFLGHFPKEIIKRKVDQEMKITLVNDSIFQVLGTNDPDSIVGPNPVGCVFSEYSLQKPEAWNFVRPILRENDGWALFNFTPRGLNHAHNLYQMALRNDKWFCQLLTVEDTKRPDGNRLITEQDLEEERAEGMPEWMIRQEYFCDFVAAQENLLISPTLVQNAAGKILPEEQYSYAPRIMGVDLARFGDDINVIVRRQGLMSWIDRKVRDLDPVTGGMDMVDHIIDAYHAFKPDATFIDEGYMPGVLDRLRQLGYNVTGVKFGGISSDQAYFNKSAEMAGLVKQWLIDGGCIPDDPELMAEASNVFYFYNRSSGKIQLVSKDDLKDKMGIPSPNCFDALKLTFAQRVHKVDEMTETVQRMRAQGSTTPTVRQLLRRKAA